MISFRTCKKCRKTFEAEVGKDLNVYCEGCRELMDILSSDEDYMRISLEQENASDGTLTSIPEESLSFSDISPEDIQAALSVPIDAVDAPDPRKAKRRKRRDADSQHHKHMIDNMDKYGL